MPPPHPQRLQSLLLVLAALLARLAGPAQAQFPPGHVHQWTPYLQPDFYFEWRHLGGGRVTAADPANPCEPLVWYATSINDPDRCVSPGYPFPNGVVNDGAIVFYRWTGSGETYGHYGNLIDVHFYNNEYTDPADGQLYGASGSANFGVDRDWPPERLQHTLSVEIRNQNSQFAVDPPFWRGDTIYVNGSRCWVKNGRDVNPEKHAT